MSTPPSLDIVTVNWNAGPMLRRSLGSIGPALDESFVLRRVVVVDNASTDDSLSGLRALPVPVTVIRNGENRGFGAACNQGAAGSEADYVLFLNPDAYLQADSLVVPLRFMESPGHEDVGIVGIQLRDGAGRIVRSCARVPTAGMFAARALGLDALLPGRVPSVFLTDWDHGDTRELDHVIGAFYMVRRRLFEQLHGFDERFFVYLEDLDFSVRARRGGWRIYYLAESHAEHTGGGTSEAVKASRIAYSLHSRMRYGFKHFSRPVAVALAVLTLCVEPFPRLARAFGRADLTEVRDTCRAFIELWRRILRDRRRGQPV
jgi:N-acetylglucosaminyl-diphospho-decaprenol L-rhamnosyltransferase